MKDFDPQDPLWQLLGRAKTPEVSPFFARSVVREIRQTEQERPVSWLAAWLRPLAIASACAALVVGVWTQVDQDILGGALSENLTADTQAPSALDRLIASEESLLPTDAVVF